MDQATALIISDDPDFSRLVMDRWQGERNAPAFTLMSGDLCHDLDADAFDMAIVGAVNPGILPSVLRALDLPGKPVLLACKTKPSAQEARHAHPGVRILQQHPGWLDTLVLVSAEVLRLGQAMARADGAEQAGKSLERQAALGRYSCCLNPDRSPPRRARKLKPSATWPCACTKSCNASPPSKRN